MNILFGIKNCDTVRKAKTWLKDHHVKFQYHDFRDDGINKVVVNLWLNQLSWQDLLNQKSTTWRGLTVDEKSDLDQQKAINLMVTHPTLIKRPVFICDEKIVLGFSSEKFCQTLGIRDV